MQAPMVDVSPWPINDASIIGKNGRPENLRPGLLPIHRAHSLL